MFRKKEENLFGGSVEPDCAYCGRSEDGTCGAPGKPCGRFRYDPLLRAPRGAAALPQHDPGEFKL